MKKIYFQQFSVRTPFLADQEESLEAFKKVFADDEVEFVCFRHVQEDILTLPDSFDMIIMSASSFQDYDNKKLKVKERLKRDGKLILFSTSTSALEKVCQYADYFFQSKDIKSTLNNETTKSSLKRLLAHPYAQESTFFMKKILKNREINLKEEERLRKEIELNSEQQLPLKRPKVFRVVIICLILLLIILMYFYGPEN